MSTPAVVPTTATPVAPKAAPPKIPNGVKFLFGGLAGMGATGVVQPLDLVKNRMQMLGASGGPPKSSVQVVADIIKKEGFSELYNGLSAGLLRQATYTTTRLGIYTWLFEKFSKGDSSPGFFKKAGLGMTAGAVGAFVGTPSDLALIRMTSDGESPGFFKKAGLGMTAGAVGAFVGTPSDLALIRMTSDGESPGFFKKAGLGMTAGAVGAFVGTPSDLALIRMTSDGESPGFFKKAGLGMTAGAVGAFVGTPSDLALIRMTSDGESPGFFKKAGLGMTAGAVGAFVGTPSDLALIRMTSDGESPGFFKKAGLGMTAGAVGAFVGTPSDLALIRMTSDGESPGFFKKAGLGMTAGAVGAFVGTPSDLALIRMTSDGRLPADQRRNYKSVFDALFRVVKEEGFTNLWRGCGPTISRAMVVNAAQLATYSQAKQILLDTEKFVDGIFLHFVASMISGLATTAASMPVDIAKTRIQNMKVINGVPEYKSSVDVWRQVVTKEGVLALWRGFMPYYMRLGPHTVITFVLLEQMNAAYLRSAAAKA